jgi:hypothetical protein
MPLQFTTEEQDTLLAWAAPRCGMPGCVFPPSAHALGVVSKAGDILAVGVYIPLFTGGVECHFASSGTKRWATRDGLRALFAYPFLLMGADRITAVVAADDISTLAPCIKSGWQIEARIRNAMPSGSDGIALSMTKGQCDWLETEVSHGW